MLTWPPSPAGAAGFGAVTFDAGDAYRRGELVAYSGSIYRALVDVAASATTPDASASWELLVAAGDLGPDGPQGDAGPAGTIGAFRGPWEAGTAYLASDIVQHLGSLWYATLPSTGTAPPTTSAGTSPTWKLVTASTTAGGTMGWKGAYASGTAYTAGDVVVSGHILYVAKAATTGAPPATSPAMWDVIDAGLPQLYASDGTLSYARSWQFTGNIRVDKTQAPQLLTIHVRAPTASQVAQSVGAPVPFADLALAGGYVATTVNPQVGMDLGGVVYLRGAVYAMATGRAVIAGALPQILRPRAEARFPIAVSNGTQAIAIVATDGTISVNGTAGTSFYLDAIAFPSAIAFGDARKRTLEFLNASNDPTTPMTSTGNNLYGCLIVSVTDGSTDLLRFDDDVDVLGHWHFAGTGTYAITTGASAGVTGTVNVNRNDTLRASFTPALPSNPGLVRVCFNPGQLTAVDTP